ncbi:MAG: thiol reductant ABC exporter subunit CydD [Marinobacter sp.]|uniref:thiol reductant ABC exporter subunit CydD n=1 Tax=Marinobacter sp. TaxID=50741 RepID=UPI00299D2889|nr:thiol reductant ABC exporter subunit CydD [Marinobacter sp.]MDX1634077.1 thiol reductant ABC exporter subunit CydD [Marinobacter sp.]
MEARREIRMAVVAGSLAGLMTILQMVAIAAIVHKAVVGGMAVAALAPWFALLLVSLCGRAVAQSLQGKMMARSSDVVRRHAREQLMTAWEHLGPVRLREESAGSLSREWLDHIEALHGYFARYLSQRTLALLVPLLILAVVAWFDWLAALLLLLAAPLIPMFMALVGMGAENLNRRHFEAIGRLSGQFLDRVRALTTLQLFGRAEAAANQLQRRSDEYRRLTMRTLKVAFLSSAVLEFFAAVSIAVVAMYIGFGLLGYIDFGPAPELTLFSGLLILMLAPEFFQPLRLLAQHYHDRAAALGAGQLITQRLARARQVAAPETAPSGSRSGNTIELEQVCVRFEDGRLGLDTLSLTLHAGERLAVTGPSGSGKTTLLSLLAGFVQPSQGRVSVFGSRPGARPFGWLGQSPYRVHGSWAEHLRLVAPEASDEALMTALEQAGLGELVLARPKGLASSITEQGQGLSGGQARRLSLARLFLAKPDLILLDEPTAGLDPDTEQRVLSALADFTSRGCTLVFATHHDSLLALATRTLALPVRGGGRA